MWITVTGRIASPPGADIRPRGAGAEAAAGREAAGQGSLASASSRATSSTASCSSSGLAASRWRIIGLMPMVITAVDGAHPVGERGPGRREQVAQAHELVTEHLLAGAAVRHQRVHGGLVLFHEADDRELLADDAGVAAEDLGPGLGGPGLAGAPGDDLLQLGPVVLDEAADDVLLGLEVVVQGGLGDAKPFRDLPQRGLLVALLREQLQRDRLDALPGAAARELAARPVPGRGLTAGRADATGAVPGAGPAPGRGRGDLQRRGRAQRGGASRLIHRAAPRISLSETYLTTG